MFSNIIMSYLISNKLMVPAIDFAAYAGISLLNVSISKKKLNGEPENKETIQESIDTLRDYAINFLQVSNIFSYFNADGTPSRKTLDLFEMKVKIIRRMAYLKLLIIDKQGDSFFLTGHALVIEWEITQTSQTTFHVNFNIIDNLPFHYYTYNDYNVDVQHILLGSMNDNFKSKIKNILIRNEIFRNKLPMNRNDTEDGLSFPYTCWSCARRALLYGAILEDQSLFERENALETYVPIEQIINYKKRKILSATEARYANNLMMYVNSINKIIEFLMTNPLIWTDRDLLAVDPQEIASTLPFPIYTIDTTPFTFLTVKYYHDLKFKKYSNMPLFVNLSNDTSKITLVNTDSKHHDKKEFYFDLDQPTAFSTTPPALFDERPPDYCTVSTQYNKQLIHSIRHLHARLLRLELAKQ